MNRRSFVARAGGALAFGKARAQLAPSPPKPPPSPQEILKRWRAGWANPPRTFKPHTRWWWPGSAVTREGIDWQLAQMKEQGIGGVEVIACWEMYEKGNIAYLSEEWLATVRYAIEKAASLDMEFSLTFAPGWDFGGFWVPPQHRSKVLTAAYVDVDGGKAFEGPLPEFSPPGGQWRTPWLADSPHKSTAPDENHIVAAVAGRLEAGKLDASNLTVLSGRLKEDKLDWMAPPGRWRVMVFRLKYTGQRNSAQNFTPENWIVDHLDKEAMKAYCEHLGGAFKKAFGGFFGKTVDSLFADSFEVSPIPGTVLWSRDTLAGFEKRKGYDLTPYLPAIWWDIGPMTSRVRYDVNEYLHWLGLEATFKTFVDWCAANKVQARIQPHYRFTEEIIQGAGMAHRPETEVTTARFEVVPDPRKATVAGARFYGRWFVSAEAYTFLHRERYRSSLEEMKIATDAFLRDGVTQFYNHGYLYSPEKDVAPSRDVPWANRISHWNTWWSYYKHLAAYISRCSFLLRQGAFAGDVLVYSPQAAVWTQKVVFGIERRVMPYGDLAKTLVANGYDFDPVNDDVLQNRAKIEKGRVRIQYCWYRFLILPRIDALPVETLRFMRDFAEEGGVVIALDRLPSASVGLQHHQARDEEVKGIVGELFGPGGTGHFLPHYKIAGTVFNSNEQPWQPTPPLTPGQTKLLELMKGILPPDFALEGGKQSDGLTFLHKRQAGNDIYFVTNLQPKPVRENVTFRVAGKAPERWDPMTGQITPVTDHKPGQTSTEVPLRLDPWESAILVFSPGKPQPKPAPRRRASPFVPLEVKGRWKVTLEGVRYPRRVIELDRLATLTDSPETRHFSGTAIYENGFLLPATHAARELVLDLGAVGCVAEVLVNGKLAGVRWMQPYRIRLTGLVEAGENRLEVRVTNLLIHHVTGLQELPEVPDQLRAHYGRTSPKYTIAAQRAKQEINFKPLPPSGLIGPVRILEGSISD